MKDFSSQRAEDEPNAPFCCPAAQGRHLLISLTAVLPAALLVAVFPRRVTRGFLAFTSICQGPNVTATVVSFVLVLIKSAHTERNVIPFWVSLVG